MENLSGKGRGLSGTDTLQYPCMTVLKKNTGGLSAVGYSVARVTSLTVWCCSENLSGIGVTGFIFLTGCISELV